MRITAARDLERVDFAKSDGLVPVIAQHARTGEVLMLAWANRDALERTLTEGRMWYWSRSRHELWRKGDTSGNVQHLVSLHLDCDGDALVARVDPSGPSCHTGDWSCFAAPPTLAALQQIVDARRADAPAGSYTRRLLDDRNLRLKKLGEEAIELALACRDAEPHAVAEEAADLLYHVVVACTASGAALDDVLRVLANRRAG